MKYPVTPGPVAFILLGLLAPLDAQNPNGVGDDPLASAPGCGATAAADLRIPLPTLKAEGLPAEEPAVLARQDTLTLSLLADSWDAVRATLVHPVLDRPSVYRQVAARAVAAPDGGDHALRDGLAMVSAAYRAIGSQENPGDCRSVAFSIRHRLLLERDQMLDLVSRELAANPACACEVVKTAILAIDADIDEVVAITEAAILAAPEEMRLISQCAIAANPEALAAVQALLARLDPQGGDSASRAKSAKGAKVAAAHVPPPSDPLNRPPEGPPLPPPWPIPPVDPDPVTRVDPCPKH